MGQNKVAFYGTTGTIGLIPAMAKCQRLVVRQFTSGLANRLRALTAIMALGRIHRKRVFLDWKPSWACPCRFEEIFECPDLGLAREEEIRAWETEGAALVFKGNRGISAATAPASHYRDLVADRLSKAAYFKSVREMARSIRLVPGLRDKFDRFVGSWPESVIGLHVRRTDLKAKFSGAGVHDDGKLMDRVDQLLSANPRRKVLLCTDNEASLVLYQNRFGGRVLVFPKSFDDRSADREEKRDTKVEDAACDLYALACTELIAGTRHSSFTEYAAFLGDIRSEAY